MEKKPGKSGWKVVEQRECGGADGVVSLMSSISHGMTRLSSLPLRSLQDNCCWSSWLDFRRFLCLSESSAILAWHLGLGLAVIRKSTFVLLLTPTPAGISTGL
jgi:hypothetical protein